MTTNDITVLNQNTEQETASNNPEEHKSFRDAAIAFAQQNSFSLRDRAKMLEREIQKISFDKEKLYNKLYILKDLKKKKDPKFSEEELKQVKEMMDEMDEKIYIKSEAAKQLTLQAQTLDNQVISMINGVEEREVNLIKKFKFKFEADKIIIINKAYKMEPFTTPGIRYHDEPEKMWTYNPYEGLDKVGVNPRPPAKEYIITVDQDFDKEILAIAQGLNLMMPELLAQQTQYYAIKKMTAEYLQKFLKR